MSSVKANSSLPAVPDDELMASVSAGSVKSFREIYDRYCDRAYRVARSVSREESQAEDSVRAAFLTVWRSRRSYQPERGSVSAWLLTAVRDHAVDLARRNESHNRRRSSQEHVAAHPGARAVTEEVPTHDAAARLRASLQKLPDAQQEVIILAFFGQLSHAEIAAQLGLPAGTVRGRMRLGMQKLRTEAGQRPT